jgi:endonuclease/exonuclease/phosphatase family metal-dependent hydrolase
MKIRITTFNCENLYGRYRFIDTPSPTATTPSPQDYTRLIQILDVVGLEGRKNTLKPKAINDVQRANTAGAILGAKPDILCVNEVENIQTLRIFNARYLKDYFDRLILIAGNDPRGINVGLMVRREFKADLMQIRTHADEEPSGHFLFSSNRLNTKVIGAATYSRDCLEVDVNVAGKPLTLLVNHLKAQDIKKGKDSSTARRLSQAKDVARLVQAVQDRKRLPIVLGDLNKDSHESAYDGSLDPLVNNSLLYDPFAAQLAPAELWSHYYTGDRKVSRLDYILLDKSLKTAVQGVEFFRQGLTPACKQYTGPRLPKVTDKLEASDHCPTTVVLDL